MKSAIVSIGTELTSGQILNRNSFWISQQLMRFGVSSEIHISVPDDRQQIQSAFHFASERGDLVFITGGLGPTTDDFTRDEVAKFLGLEMEFNAATWDYIQSRLKTRGFEVRDFQKQQCFFPKTAEILTNDRGTAHGFRVVRNAKHYFVLPGPPNEIESVWQNHIESRLQSILKNVDKKITRAWSCLGLGESDIAAIVEPLASGKGLEVAYRIHWPYVEVKLSYFQSKEKSALPTLAAVDQALATVTALKDGADVAKILAQQLEKITKDGEKIVFIDRKTNGFLLRRLYNTLMPLMGTRKVLFVLGADTTSSPDDTVFSIFDIGDETQFTLQRSKRPLARQQVRSSYVLSTMQERSLQYLAEKALLFWSSQLSV